MKLLLTVLMLAAMAGCGANRPAVDRQSFLIQPERVGTRAMKPVAGVLRIGRVEVASPYDARAWIYRRSDVRYETDFYNEFVANPSDMLAEATTGWLRHSGLFEQVVPSTTATVADYRLEASVGALYIDFRDETPAAILNLRWQLLREEDKSNVLDVDCEERVALVERSPPSAARAYREAALQALARLEKALVKAQVLIKGR